MALQHNTEQWVNSYIRFIKKYERKERKNSEAIYSILHTFFIYNNDFQVNNDF